MISGLAANWMLPEGFLLATLLNASLRFNSVMSRRPVVAREYVLLRGPEVYENSDVSTCILYRHLMFLACSALSKVGAAMFAL